MKIRNGFITNSSSASFIITILTKNDMSIEEFKSKFIDFLDYYKKNYSIEDHRPISIYWKLDKINKITNNVFEIKDYTIMFNDMDNVPRYMRKLLLMSFIYPEELERILDADKINFRVED